jgi:ribosomal protein L11 methyltransferase
MKHHATPLETVSVTVPHAAIALFESALQQACGTIGLFIEDESAGTWRIEGVRAVGENEELLQSCLALAGLASGITPDLHREATQAEGWLARVYSSFPEQLIGKRFAIRGEHVETRPEQGRITLTVDAGLAFGSGEHGSTRGCLRALERIAYRHPQQILDLGCGTAILAMGAAALLRRPVLAVDIDPWSVRVAAQNARLNRLSNQLTCRLGNGWRTPSIRAAAPFDLVFANILARPLCLMAADLAAHLAPGGTAILAGLLAPQKRAVLAAHRRAGLRLDFSLQEGQWTTMVLSK